jgi:hypothetical protein
MPTSIPPDAIKPQNRSSGLVTERGGMMHHDHRYADQDLHRQARVGALIETILRRRMSLSLCLLDRHGIDTITSN